MILLNACWKAQAKAENGKWLRLTCKYLSNPYWLCEWEKTQQQWPNLYESKTNKKKNKVRKWKIISSSVGKNVISSLNEYQSHHPAVLETPRPYYFHRHFYFFVLLDHRASFSVVVHLFLISFIWFVSLFTLFSFPPFFPLFFLLSNFNCSSLYFAQVFHNELDLISNFSLNLYATMMMK